MNVVTVKAPRLPEPKTSLAALARKSTWRRFLDAIEPWYDWGATNAFRLDGLCPKFSDEVEFEVRYIELQWLGLHLEFRVGRVPARSQ